jgi:DNA primase
VEAGAGEHGVEDAEEAGAVFVVELGEGCEVLPGPPVGPSVQLAGDELRVGIDDRRWRVRGLAKVTSFEVLRVNVLVAREDERRGHVFYVDTLDLYSARARGVFCRQAAVELGLAEELVARDLGRVLLVCEERAEDAIRQAQAPTDPEVVLSDAERERAPDDRDLVATVWV